jgi:ferredoxin-NADP reductase
MLPPSLQKRPYLVVSNREIASGIFELRVKAEQEANEIPMPEAGQWVYLELPDEDGADGGSRRAYSIASAPYEIKASQGELAFAIKVTGFVSSALKERHAGDRVWVQGPFGRFTLSHDASHPVVFIGGGIGLTPLRSMIFESVQVNPNRSLTLLLSCKTKEEIPYHQELRLLSDTESDFCYTPTCTREESREWVGNRGRISKEQIEQLASKSVETEWYVCGPNALMDELASLLKEIGIAKTKIHTEKFG